MMYIAAGLIQAKMQCRQPIQQPEPWLDESTSRHCEIKKPIVYGVDSYEECCGPLSYLYQAAHNYPKLEVQSQTQLNLSTGAQTHCAIQCAVDRTKCCTLSAGPKYLPGLHSIALTGSAGQSVG